MNKEFKWIQITDMHIGKEGNIWNDALMRRKLIDFLANNEERVDFVLVTGDLFNRGNIEANKKEVGEIISELKTISNDIIICAGNHDFKRTQERTDFFKIWNQTSNKTQNNLEKNIRKQFKGDFADFKQFCADILGDKNASLDEGTYVYKEVEGVNIIVLNTSLFAGQPKYDSNSLVIENRVDDDGKLWFSDLDKPDFDCIDYKMPTIVVGHHAIQMFDVNSQQEIVSMCKSLDAIGYFCGHMHKSKISSINGVKQYVTAGLFMDDYNSPAISVFSLDIHRKLNEYQIVYKDYKWKKKEKGKFWDLPSKILDNNKQKLSSIINMFNKKTKLNQKINEDKVSAGDDNTNIDSFEKISAVKPEKNYFDEDTRKILCIATQSIEDYSGNEQNMDFSMDWYNFFFENCRLISEYDMQVLWGKILAKKVCNDTSISKRTLGIVFNLTIDEARVFNKIMKYVLQLPNENLSKETFDYFIPKPITLYKGEIQYEDIIQMQDAGLINSSSSISVIVGSEGNTKEYVYQNGNKVIKWESTIQNKLDVFLLTTSGKELYDLLVGTIEVCKDEEYYENVKKAFYDPKGY